MELAKEIEKGGLREVLISQAKKPYSRFLIAFKVLLN